MFRALLLAFACQSVCLAEKVPEKPAVILCFHDIGGKGRYSVSTADFAAILDLLKPYKVVSVRDWLSGSADRDDYIVLTFDDGYPSALTVAVPELNKRGFGATFYLYAARDPDVKLARSILAAGPGFEIGSHSHSHDDLKSKPVEVWYRELVLSRRRLEYATGRRITSWAWPYGSFPVEHEELIRAAGYENQVSTDYAPARRDDTIHARYTIQQPAPVAQLQKILKRYEAMRSDGAGSTQIPSPR